MIKLFTLFAIMLIAIMAQQQKAQAQSYFDFNVYDSSTAWCSAPASVYFYGTLQSSLYTTGELITFYINFGDGGDTTMQVPIQQNVYCYYYFYHTYMASGYYSTLQMATGPDGTADTIITVDDIFVGSSCGNLEGRIYIDNNSDCIYNAGDTPMEFVSVQAESSGATPFYLWGNTDSNGMYYMEVPNGETYEINLLNIPNYYAVTCPAAGNYTGITPSATGLDFALECYPGFDLEGNIYGGGFVPGWVSTYLNVWAFNNYCGGITGTLMVILDPLVNFSSASVPPTSVQGDTLIWDPYSYPEYFTNNYWSYINISIPMSTSAQLGDTVCFTIIAEPILGDADPTNNVETVCYVVQSSWDPNAKEVSPKGAITNSQELDYTVLFQNTGTAPAMNVYILDTLDTNLDVLTFAFQGSSHPCDVTFMGENIVKFYFHNINLPDSISNEPASHGFVNYSISLKPGLNEGTIINNTAAIYFDFNPAVITNTVSNIIDNSIGIEDAVSSATFEMYPNPATDQVTIQIGDVASLESVSLIDLSGRVLKQWTITGSLLQLHLSELPAGIYFIKAEGPLGQVTKKLVVSR